MSFFYDLNKRLQQVLETPKSEHQQLNERNMSRAAKGHEKYGKEGMQALAKAGREGKDLDKVRAKYNKYDESMEEGAHSQDAMQLNPDFKKVGAKPSIADKIKAGVKRVADVVAPGDEELIRRLEKSSGGKRPVKEASKPDYIDLDQDGDRKEPMKKAAADAKKKKSVNEADGEFTQADWDKVARKKRHLMILNRNLEPEDAEQLAAEKLGYDYEDVLAWIESDQNIAEATKEIPGGRRHTAEPGGYGRKDDDEAPKVATKKGRGRPKKGSDSETGEVMKPDFSAFGVGGKVNLPKHKGTVTKHKMVGEGDAADVEAAVKLLKKAGYTVTKGDEQVNEKAVSKSQRAAAGIAYAAKKGDVPKSELRGASKEMAKMPAGELKKFAKTKEKGLPEKKKKEVEETTVSGSVAPATEAPKKSKGGFNFGGGIYDSMNRELETMIAESMNINMSMNSDSQGGPNKSLTVTATDEDADKLAALLQMAGIGGQSTSPEAAYAEAPCQVDENQPENVPDPVSGDGEMYAGGLNKPKRDVAGDGQATGTITAVHATDDTDDEELRRIREMAGIRESKKPDFLDLDKDGDKKEPMAKAAKEKDDKEEKVDESIFASTANLWKTYKG
jgi:hypothetical protein